MGCLGCCVERNDVPAVFTEPFIKGGYRLPNQPYHYYLRSLFFQHNEFLNMWSALITIICHCYLFKYCPFFSTLWVLNISGVLIHVFSFLAHTFSHYTSKAHISCYLLDFMGIYIGFSQVIPSFLVLQFDIAFDWAAICGALALLWNVTVFNSCCHDYYACWEPWFNGGSFDQKKPRVLTFVKKGVWLYGIIWLAMIAKMTIYPPSSGSYNFHILAIVSLLAECFLLTYRCPERWYPDYFEALRSHPFTHICAGAVTMGLVKAFLEDRRAWPDDYNFKGDFILVTLSVTNICCCFVIAYMTLKKIYLASYN
ncbi:membrane progestin receptor alpha-B-like [Convolutriloba macropyga]|uniref:membrane progestin receptor alpha-B-like n=1 Tax=Convolutriloba macropyga TaxID=536237 RepID=UPI003F527349